MNKLYSELIKLKTFDERFKYLQLNGIVGELKFNGHRHLNQVLYKCHEWNSLRRRIILRDNGLDLGCEGHEIYGKILVHHINPITIDDVLERNPIIFDPENLITVSHETHNALHYGDGSILNKHKIVERVPNDTCPWKEKDQ